MAPKPTASPRAKPRQAGRISAVAEGDAKDTQIVGGLARGLEILMAFTKDDESLGNTELAERTGINKSTVSRLSYTLSLLNFLSFDPQTREYRLGTQIVSLGVIAHAATNVRKLALPLMQELAIHGSFNVGLGTREELRMLYTDTAEGTGPIGLRLHSGSRIPIATSAMGRAYVAAANDVERAELYAKLETLHGDGWPARLALLEHARAEFRQYGYCSSIGDWQQDVNGIAVPIASMPGTPRYVMNLGGPAYLLPETDLRETLAPKLVAAARSIEKVLHV